MNPNVKLRNDWEIVRESPYCQYKIASHLDLNRSFYRFMRKEVFDNMLRGTFRFSNPSCWNDPYEKLFVNGNFDAIKYTKPTVYAACFTREPNSDASWKVYTEDKENDPCIRVEFDMNRFIEALCFAGNQVDRFQLYIGDMSYDLQNNSLCALGKRTSKYHYLAFPEPFSDDNFVDLLLLKRKSFKYEQESRLIILSDESQEEYAYLKYEPAHLQYFVKSIQISPFCSLEKAKILEYEIQKSLYSSGRVPNGNAIDVRQSNLYENVIPITVERKFGCI